MTDQQIIQQGRNGRHLSDNPYTEPHQKREYALWEQGYLDHWMDMMGYNDCLEEEDEKEMVLTK